MPNGVKLLPTSGINTDLAPQYLSVNQARFIKNLYYFLGDFAEAGTAQGSNKGVLRPLQSNEVYCPMEMPLGDNHVIGTYPSRETSELYVLVHNSLNNHFIFRATENNCEIGKIDPCFNFKLEPKYFVGEGQIYLEVIYLTDPDTGEDLVKKDLYWTDGFNYQGYLRFDDSFQTNGYDATLFPYFSGTYNRCPVVRMGVPTPKDCIQIEEIPRTEEDAGLNNNLLFNTWQFRVRNVDVWGRPSEWGIISNEYVAGINDCISASANIPRCLNLTFDAGNPFINTIEVAYRNCNNENWYLSDTLFLYIGSNIGKWWLRGRNQDIIFNPDANKITYRFCADKQCDAIDVNETNRLQNPLPKISQALHKQNKVIALDNNTDGFNPFLKTLTDKFNVIVTPPDATPQSDIQTRNITIYVAIFNPAYNNLQQVSSDGSNGFFFGGSRNPAYGIVADFAAEYLQFFKNKQQSGFGGYLVGGGTAISTQVYVDAAGQLVDDPTHQGVNLSPTNRTFQKFVFNNVPKGRYIFRLFSHLTDPTTDANYENTSTTVWGRCVFNPLIYDIDTTNGRELSQELLINVCDADYDTMKDNRILCICDTAGLLGNRQYKVQSGYVWETHENGFDENPVELMDITLSGNGYTSQITDHNGFYYVASRQINTTFFFNFYYKCNVDRFIKDTGGVAGNGMTLYNHYINQEGNFQDFFTTACNRVLVNGQLKLNGTNIGISNALVTLSRGQSAFTDDNGYFSIIAHDEVKTGNRHDYLFISGGACGYSGLNGCIELIDVFIVKCGVCQERIVTVGLTELVYNSQRGLLSGGVYPLGVVGWDWLGRPTYVQQLPYINIPSIIQSRAIAASTVEITVDPTAVFPNEIEYITFFIGAETTIDKYLSWIVDRVEFIDSIGTVNNINPTQIKIYYQSVIEYNVLNNYNTTASWQFIPQGSNTPVTSDKVQFFLNGDGQFFPKLITGLVKYDQAGQYFLIDYNPDLKDLQASALIRLIRPKTCTGNEPYFEVCGRIDILNNHAAVNRITLNAFDTYYLGRQIPVPAPITPQPSTTVTTITSNTGVTTETSQILLPAPTVNELRTFGFRFESNSPSNLWGYGCWNIGRVNVKNPYEAELNHLTQIALSGALSVNGQLNYLSYFDVAQKHDVDINNSGGIVAVIPQTGIDLIVFQYNCCLIGYNDNALRIDERGQVIVPSAADKFGKPMANSVGQYGCQLFDKSTLRSKEGLVHWLDRSRIAVLQHNYVNCQDVSRYNKANSTIVTWLTQKIKYQQDYNKAHGNIRYFHSVINPSNFEYLLSDFTIGSDEFVNMERDYDVTKHETFSFDILAKVWKGHYMATPESYGFLEGATVKQILFYFKNGVAYSNTGTTYNNFFGVQGERIYRFVFCGEGDKKLFYESLAVYCKQSKYWSDLIITEAGQLSRILKSQWKKADYFWTAPFLCATNTPADPNLVDETGVNSIMDGDNLFGSFVDVRLIGDTDFDNQYSELYSVDVFVEGISNSGTK